MAPINHLEGTDGGITFAAGYVACPTSWTINFAAEDVETTCLGDVWKTRIAGLKEWNGSFTVRLTTSLATIGTGGGSGLALGTTEVPATFTATGAVFVGQIIITGADVNLAIGGTAGEITFTFVGAGELTSLT